MRNHYGWLCAALIGFMATGAVVIAGPGRAPAGSPVPRLPWVHEGLALTYTWYAARTAGNGSYYEEDANGNWILHSTGQRYNRLEQQGTSGSGWMETLVACIEGDKVVLATSTYGNAGSLGRNAPVPQGSTSILASAVDPGDYWMDPAKLASMHTNPSTNLLVQHVSWRSNNREVEGIRVQIIHGTTYSDHIYDARTGMCIHVASSFEGSPPRIVGPGDMGRGDTTITRNDFVSMRDVNIPWADEPMPDWVARIRSLHYRGAMTSHGPLPTVPNVLTFDLEALNHGRDWAEFNAVSGQQMQGGINIPPSRAQLAFGGAEIGGVWAGPAALARLRQGQVLDEDPVTQMRTVVGRVDDSSVVFKTSNAAGDVENQYDKHTGMLIGTSSFDVLTMQQRTLRLQGHE